MAATSKCIRLEVGTVPSPSSGTIGIKCLYADMTTTPPTPGVVITSMPTGDLSDPTNMQGVIDDALTAASLPTIGWSL